MHRITVISAGPGGKGYITLLAREKVKECDVIIGTGTQLDSMELLPVHTLFEESSIERILELIAEHEGKRVGVLVTGDAGIYSLSSKIIDRFGEDAVDEVIPGVSSIQVAFARIKEPWLNVKVFSYHGRPMEGLDEVLRHQRVAILCDREHSSKVVLSALVKFGLFEISRKIAVCQDLTMENERVVDIRNDLDIADLIPGRREITLVITNP